MKKDLSFYIENPEISITVIVLFAFIVFILGDMMFFGRQE